MSTPSSSSSSSPPSAARWVFPTPSSRARPDSALSFTRRYAALLLGSAFAPSLTHRQTAAVLALTEVRSEDKNELSKLVSAIKDGYLEKNESARKQWGGGIMGYKAQKRIERRKKAMESAIKV